MIRGHEGEEMDERTQESNISRVTIKFTGCNMRKWAIEPLGHLSRVEMRGVW